MRRTVNTGGSPGKIQVDFGDREVNAELRRKVADRIGKLNRVISENKAGGSSNSGSAAIDNSLTLKRCHQKLATIARYEDGSFISDIAEYRDFRDLLCSQFALMGLDTPETMMLDSELFQGECRLSTEF